MLAHASWKQLELQNTQTIIKGKSRKVESDELLYVQQVLLLAAAIRVTESGVYYTWKPKKND